jgi:CheY-like chemotaxis protein
MKAFNTVLIADADAEIRAQYRAAFVEAAEAVHESEDGAEALGKAICHRPDLVVAETRLRRIDGLSLCQLLRDDPTTRHVSIIVVTSASSAEELSRAQIVGADRVLQKPCTPERLLDAARDLRHDVAAPVRVALPSYTPLPLECPVCHSKLVYQKSHLGGVKNTREQWDDYECPMCGPYQYRQRTRKLKAL